jgi:purine-nucleoside phosphorylase
MGSGRAGLQCPQSVGLYEQTQEAAQAVKKKLRKPAQVGIILGSGLGDFAERLSDQVAIPYHELPHFPVSSVPGHKGRLVAGTIGGVGVACMQGRVHLYEGYPAWQVAFPARVLCSLGIRGLVLTNAAGGIRADLVPGDLMRITDHINLSGSNPLVGPNDDRLGPRFPDLSRTYDKELGERLVAVARRLGIELKHGVYVQLLGPSYETPAEIRSLRTMGGDAVGMSTIPETVVAAHMGVKVAGISCITNLASGIGDGVLSHDEVSRIAARVRDRFGSLLEAFLPEVA